MKLFYAKKLVKALRSGRYKQIRGKLHTKKGYCCLGVLCRVAGKRFTPHGRGFACLGESLALPEEVMKLTGMKTNEGLYKGKPTDEKQGIFGLTYLNDNRKADFKTIADYIEANWKDL